MTLFPFATPDQLAASLGVDVPDGLVLSQWEAALDDASGYLRTVIGQPITADTATLALTTDGRGEADIWLVPVTSITSIVDSAGNPVPTDRWKLKDQRLMLPLAYETYTVELAYGYDEPPSELVRWTKVLASTQIQAAGLGSLGLTNVTSVDVDDGKVTYSGAMTVALPDATAQWLKATFGGPQ